MHYGYEVKDDDDDCGDIIPKVVANVMPENFPMPCKCVKLQGRQFAHVENMDCYVANTATVRLTLAKTHMVLYSDKFIFWNMKDFFQIYDFKDRL